MSVSKRCVTHSVLLLCTVFKIVNLAISASFLKHSQNPNYFRCSDGTETIKTNNLSNFSRSFNCWMIFIFGGGCLSFQSIHHYLLDFKENNFIALTWNRVAVHRVGLFLTSFKLKTHVPRLNLSTKMILI